MSYTFFFLLGIPAWLIPVAYMLRHKAARLECKTAWAAMTFLAPFLIFSLGAVGHLVAQQRLEVEGSGLRAFGYFTVLLNVLAFVSPFILQGIFRTRYAAHQGQGVS